MKLSNIMKIYLPITEEDYKQGFVQIDSGSDPYEIYKSLKELKSSISKEWMNTNNFYVVVSVDEKSFSDNTHKYLKPGTKISLKGLQPQLIFEEEYRKCLEVKPSKIHGKGLFTNSSFKKDTCLFVAIVTVDPKATTDDKKYKVTEIGKWVNHSTSANGKLIQLGSLFFFKLIKSVSANDELTGDYHKTPIPMDLSFEESNENYFHKYFR